MGSIVYRWKSNGAEVALEFVRVEGTGGTAYRFGEGDESALIDVREFWMATVTVTQGLWLHVMGGENPALGVGLQRPVENVSWHAIGKPGGFLARINGSAIRDELVAQAALADGVFRLPTETEWEYAARGGSHWRDGFPYSGGNDIDALAWYNRKWGDHTHEVAQKKPNQLGIYDMSGNVWEWCEDSYTKRVEDIPKDGSAFTGRGEGRILRGGCFHNWAIHCTVSKRYQIGEECHDGCIGFRLVLSEREK